MLEDGIKSTETKKEIATNAMYDLFFMFQVQKVFSSGCYCRNQPKAGNRSSIFKYNTPDKFPFLIHDLQAFTSIVWISV